MAYTGVVDIASIIIIIIINVNFQVLESFTVKLTPNIKEQTSSLGGSFVSTCTYDEVSPHDNIRIHWFDPFNRTIKDVDGNQRVFYEKVQSGLKLFVKHINEKDTGKYSCRVQVNNQMKEEHFKLTLLQQITFLDVPLFQHPIIHTDAQIKCHVVASPTPYISWKYNGRHPINNDASSRDIRKVVQHGYLLIKNISMADNGLYTCAAELPSAGAYDERVINVTVYIPPKIVKSIGHVTEVEGNPIEVTCNATGLPRPKFKFFKGKKHLQSNNRIEINEDQGILRIKSVAKGDDGSYVCRAHSEAGNHSAEGTINVKVPPKITELRNLTLEQGTTATMVCKVKGDTPLNIVFIKEITKETFGEGFNQDRYSISRRGNELTLQITYLRPNDMSAYICKATNEYGKDDLFGYLEVTYKPEFPKKGLKEYSWIGRVHNITCTVHANPPVTGFVWERYGRNLTNNDTYRMSEYKGNYSLQIRVKRPDERWIYGQYICIAQNAKGSTRNIITLEKGEVPGQPRVYMLENTANVVTLRVEPPKYTGNVEVNGYRVELNNFFYDFNIADPKKGSEKLKLENLKMNSKYTVRIRAKNEVGSGPEQNFTFTTASKSKPYPIVINSNREGPNAFQYKLAWETPKTGGIPIREYEIKYRKSMNQNQLWALKEECSAGSGGPGHVWQEIRYSDNPQKPTKSHTLYDLEPETNYDVIIHAYNDLGKSDTTHMFCFRTSKVQRSSSLSSAAVLSLIGVHSIALDLVFVLCYAKFQFLF